jgi:(S)-3,5-dihydroxyphenylglycine transaminase
MRFSSQTPVMTFLNEVADEYPSAISLAAGRPTDQFAATLNPAALVEAFSAYESFNSRGHHTTNKRTMPLQYGRTAGIINDLVAEQLRIDEDVIAVPDRVLITAGCQEALALCLPALCPNQTDAVLVCNPTYIGAAGAAYASGVSVYPIPNTFSILEEGIEQAANELRRSGRRARALYLIPSFDNPTGHILDEDQRKNILAICARLQIVILEDNPYGMFRYDGAPVRPMAALDDAGCVIYLSTFSKTIAPAMRIGAATLPDTIFGDRSARTELWNNLVQRKSVLTLNTSQITQAIVGGLLLESNCSLRRWIEPALNLYRNNRDAMLTQLEAEIPSITADILWNQPSGGFFLSLDLPFQFGAGDVVDCATNYGVIVMPMSFFAFDDSQDQRVRLSFSAAEPQQIRLAISSLARYATSRIEQLTVV